MYLMYLLKIVLSSYCRFFVKGLCKDSSLSLRINIVECSVTGVNWTQALLFLFLSTMHNVPHLDVEMNTI